MGIDCSHVAGIPLLQFFYLCFLFRLERNLRLDHNLLLPRCFQGTHSLIPLIFDNLDFYSYKSQCLPITSVAVHCLQGGYIQFRTGLVAENYCLAKIRAGQDAPVPCPVPRFAGHVPPQEDEV